MMIKSLLKDLMDTLLTDLLQLIDGHTSYVEETLLLYSSKYQQGIRSSDLTLQSGVEPDTWKCFLQHLHRKYDIFDRMFLWKDPIFEIIRYVVRKGDCKAFYLLTDKPYFDDKKDREWTHVFNNIIQQDDVRMFKLFSTRIMDIPLDQVFDNLVSHNSYRILRLYMDQLDLESLNYHQASLAIVAMRFDINFIRKLFKVNQKFHDKSYVLEFFDSIICDCKNYEHVILKMIDILNLSFAVKNNILMSAMGVFERKLIELLLTTYDYGSIFDIMVHYISNDENDNQTEMLRFLNENGFIDDNELIELHELIIKTWGKRGFLSYGDSCTLETYKWMINKYIQVNPNLDLLEHNNIILTLCLNKTYGSDEIAIHILNQYPTLPLNKFEPPDYVDGTIYSMLYLRNKINLDVEKLSNHISFKVFKVVYGCQPRTDLSLEIANKLASEVLMDTCYFDLDNLQEFIGFINDNNITLDYQQVMETVLCGNEWEPQTNRGERNLVETLKILKQHNKIKDHYRLFKMVDSKKSRIVYRYLLSALNAEPEYGYI